MAPASGLVAAERTHRGTFPPGVPTRGRMQPTSDSDRRGATGWPAVALVAVILLVASVLPSPLRRRPEFGRVGPDKLLHVVGYAGFAAVLADALAGERRGTPPAVGAVVVAAGYGLLTGRLQDRVPGRAAERADHVAGFLGAVFGALAWRSGRLDGCLDRLRRRK